MEELLQYWEAFKTVGSMFLDAQMWLVVSMLVATLGCAVIFLDKIGLPLIGLFLDWLRKQGILKS